MNTKQVLNACIIVLLLLITQSTCFASQLAVVDNIFGGKWIGAIDQRNPSMLSWLGIEYAKSQRFELSKMLNETNEVRALEFGPWCPQSPVTARGLDGPGMDEDCLFLNIHVPKSLFEEFKSDPKSFKKLPVVVYIHGGAFLSNSGSGQNQRPETFTKRGIIYISFNYRLDLLGFFSHPNLTYTNFGLLDQRTALEWIRINIPAFGGDASQITVMGDSAGAISILHHLTSFQQRKDPIFQRAILLSPGIFSGNQFTKEKFQAKYLEISQHLGCIGSPTEILDCMKAKPASEMRMLINRLPSPFILTTPTSQRTTGFPINDDLFFPDLATALNEGEFDKNVPVIVGSDLHEGSLFGALAFPIFLPTEEMLEQMIRASFGPKAKDVLGRYNKQNYGSVENAYYELSSHMFTAQGTCQTSRLLSKYSKSPIYRYGNFHLFHYSNRPEMGVFHTSALGLLYKSTGVGLWPEQLSEVEIELADKWGDLIARFIQGDTFSESEWPTYSIEKHQEIHIGRHNNSLIEIGEGFLKDDCDFWEALYPPHGLFIPPFEGNIYEYETTLYYLANQGFWTVVVYWRVSLAIFGVIIIAMLYGFYRGIMAIICPLKKAFDNRSSKRFLKTKAD